MKTHYFDCSNRIVFENVAKIQIKAGLLWVTVLWLFELPNTPLNQIKDYEIQLIQDYARLRGKCEVC